MTETGVIVCDQLATSGSEVIDDIRILGIDS